MWRALITAVFAGCIGSVPAQPKASLENTGKSSITRSTHELVVNPVKINVSTIHETKKISNLLTNTMNEASKADDSDKQGQGGGTLIAIVILMVAIALRRQRSRKY